LDPMVSLTAENNFAGLFNRLRCASASP